MTRINAYHPAGHVRGIDVPKGGDFRAAIRILRAMVAIWPQYTVRRFAR